MYSNKISPFLKAHLFKTYIRPITYYGLENCKIIKCEMRKLQTMEGLMTKQTLSLEKRSRTTNQLYALNIEPVDSKIQKLKLNSGKRIIENDYTEKVFRKIELKVNDESAFIKELREILGSSDQITKENQIKKEDSEKSKKGICDSIKYFLQNLKERKEELKLLVKAYLPRTERNAEFV
ncbi:hypothetical protein BpHYR1_017024 [Brachionus plicatilis]|uniref:Uncharacterized protein n=1 Tax=Brachionus plicatilis TaxID=10195 RepID=A0A3M7RPR3_BRAPC|nr:hypothetical protein BpHYR1_017024 [Brachionus plicatilis]